MGELIKILVNARKAMELSQDALGKKLGIPQSHLSKIEQGKVDMRLSNFVDMARLLGLEVILVPKEWRPVIEGMLNANSQNNEEKSLPERLLSDSEEMES